MTMKLTWRKTVLHYALLKWEHILQKAELPYEYVNGEGAKLWYDPLSRCIQLGGDGGKDCTGTFPDQLRVGTILEPEQHESLVKYLSAAAGHLLVIKTDMKTAETVVDEL